MGPDPKPSGFLWIWHVNGTSTHPLACMHEYVHALRAAWQLESHFCAESAIIPYPVIPVRYRTARQATVSSCNDSTVEIHMDMVSRAAASHSSTLLVVHTVYTYGISSHHTLAVSEDDSL